MSKGNAQLNLFVLPSAAPIIKGMVTWRHSANCNLMGIDLPLEDEDKLIVARLAMEYGFIVKLDHINNVGNFISECEGLVCAALRLINVEPPGLLRGTCFTIPIPPMEPASTILGLLLALPILRLMGRRIIYEVFSDRWFRFKDLLLYLKLRGLSMNIYTTSPELINAFIFDRVVKRRGKLNFGIPEQRRGELAVASIADRVSKLIGGYEAPLRALVDLGVPISEINELIMYGIASLDMSNGIIVFRINKH